MMKASLFRGLGPDLLVWCAMAFYCWACPWTKVEESFNAQAAHDTLFLLPSGGGGLEHFDHLDFPGVVPRSFLGTLLITGVLAPVRLLLPTSGIPKTVWLDAYRLVLGTLVVAALGFLRRRAEAVLAPPTNNNDNRNNNENHRSNKSPFGLVFALVCASQFHLLFYASRPLPNTLALVLTTLATGYLLPRTPAASVQASAETSNHRQTQPVQQQRVIRDSVYAVALLAVASIIFRCDTVVFAGPHILALLLRGRLTGWRWIPQIIAVCLAAITLTCVVDSQLWRRTLWPELEVLLFNTVENRSSEWGTQPWPWYFVSALPRALLLAYPAAFMAFLGTQKEARRVHHASLGLLLPTLAYIALYSCLPHKELRFVFPALPVMNVLAARFVCILLSQGRPGRPGGVLRALVRVGLFGVFLASLLATGVFLGAALVNYPGGEAAQALNQYRMASSTSPTSPTPSRHHPVEPCKYSVHIGNLAATTGVTRFHDPCVPGSPGPFPVGALRHNKTEGLETAMAAALDETEVYGLLPEDTCYLLSEQPRIHGFELVSEESRYGGVVPVFEGLPAKHELLSLVRAWLRFDFSAIAGNGNGGLFGFVRTLFRTRPAVYILRRVNAPWCL